jgi:N-acetylglucosamine repressor
MKGLNEASILKIIREHGPISRSDIAQMLNVSIPTATRITDSLLTDGLIVSVGFGLSSGGRSAPNLEINPTGAYIFGAEVTNNIEIALTNLKAEVIDASSVPAIRFGNPAETIKHIAATIDEMVIRNKIPDEKVYGVGIGTPGINFRANSIIEQSVFKGWNNVNIEELISSSIKYKTFVENIAYTSTLKEYWFGSGIGCGNFVNLLVDNGIGGGIILDGKLYKGMNGKAGHLGHISIENDGEYCYCGNKGCIERYASIPAIEKRVKRLIKDGVDTSLILEKPDLFDITYADICRASENGDDLCIKVLREAGRKLGSVVASISNIFDPELVIISGGVVRNNSIVFEECRAEALDRTFSFINVKRRMGIIKGNDRLQGPLGCVALVMESIFSQKL